jgi:hypothetical protein
MPKLAESITSARPTTPHLMEGINQGNKSFYTQCQYSPPIPQYAPVYSRLTFPWHVTKNHWVSACSTSGSISYFLSCRARRCKTPCTSVFSCAYRHVFTGAYLWPWFRAFYYLFGSNFGDARFVTRVRCTSYNVNSKVEAEYDSIYKIHRW